MMNDEKPNRFYRQAEDAELMAGRIQDLKDELALAIADHEAAEARCAALEALAVELAGLLNEAACTYESLRCDTGRFRTALSSPLLAELRAKEAGR
jgi:hypothetical protein